MKTLKLIIPVALILLLAGQAVAQTDVEEKQAALQKVQEREVLVQEKLEDAERQMAEAEAPDEAATK